MREVYIVSAVRTAIGRFGGSLQPLTSSELGAVVIREAVERAHIDTAQIEEVILGNVFQAGGKANPARQAALIAGLPVEIPAMTINKQCASGLRSITIAYQEILAGEADLIVAGGTESMSNVPHLLLDARWGKKMGSLSAVDGLLYDGLHCGIEGYHMGVTAENIAEQYGISREDQDDFAYSSQQKALSAIREGRFEKEIVPVEVPSRKGSFTFKIDEHPRETTTDQLQKLSSAFTSNGSVTAGNSSGINDGAACVVLASGEKVKELGLTPIARIRSVSSAAVPPSIMGIGPVPATKKALSKAQMTITDIDLIELNEAFAAQSLAVIRELDIPSEKVNVNGGAIALGHPVGCSGARIVVTLIHALEQKEKQIGLATLCIGGGQGASIIVERV